MSRRYYRRPSAPNSAIDEGREQAGLGDLPEDLLKERKIRPPILTPRGYGTDNPFQQMPPTLQVPANRIFSPQSLNTFPLLAIPAGIAIQVYAATRERSYSIIINAGANDCVISYNRQPISGTDGIPLAAAGVGFHELIYGTTSTVWAFSTAGTSLSLSEGRYDPPMES